MYFKKVNFEIKPLLTKIFTEEYAKNNTGTKIKDPLIYLLQLAYALQINNMTAPIISFFIKQQGMDLFNQINVKGWQGGNNWLTSQIYLQRNNTADLLCSGRTLLLKKSADNTNEPPALEIKKNDIAVNWNRDSKNNIALIADLANQFLFTVDENMQKDMEKILKYDFDPGSSNADFAVLRLFNYITKTPEFQLI